MHDNTSQPISTPNRPNPTELTILEDAPLLLHATSTVWVQIQADQQITVLDHTSGYPVANQEWVPVKPTTSFIASGVVAIKGPVNTKISLWYPTDKLVLPLNSQKANIGHSDSEHGFLVHASSTPTAIWSVDSDAAEPKGNNSIEVFVPTTKSWIVIPRLKSATTHIGILVDGVVRCRYRSQANGTYGQIQWRSN